MPNEDTGTPSMNSLNGICFWRPQRAKLTPAKAGTGHISPMVLSDDARKLLRQQLSRGRFGARLTLPQ
jgi:hypothetical protein